MKRTKTEILLIIMNVLAWIAYIGFVIKAGAIAISYGVSVANPQGAMNLYKGLDLHLIRQFNFWDYTATVFLLVAICVLQALTANLVIKVLSKINIANPFRAEFSRLFVRMSYFIIAIWAVTMIYDGHMVWLSKQLPGLQQNLISGDFVFFAGLAFVMAQIFKRGVEIQSENELTV